MISRSLQNQFINSIPTTSNAYWLSDTTNILGYNLRSYSQTGRYADVESNKKELSGKTKDGQMYLNETFDFGMFDFVSDDRVYSFYQPAKTYLWRKDSKESSTLNKYEASSSFEMNGPLIGVGDVVYNNPYFVNDPNKGYHSTTITEANNDLQSVLAKIIEQDNMAFPMSLTLYDSFSSGVKLYSAVGCKLSNDTGFFKVYSDYYGVYFKARRGSTKFPFGTCVTDLKNGGSLFGYSSVSRTINGTNISAGRHHLRPLFNLKRNDIAFLRDNNSSQDLSPETDFSLLSQFNNFDCKTVIISDNTQIINSLYSSKLTLNKFSFNEVLPKYHDSIIEIPVGATEITFNATSFETRNANHISALVNGNSGIKYALLGTTSSDIAINLSSILNKKIVGSQVNLSFYAEQLNNSNNSDLISSVPITIQLRVVKGAEHKITYDLNGADGILPKSDTTYSGLYYGFADGSSLNKDGNNFSSWQVSYCDFEDNIEKHFILKPGDTFVVPNTKDGKIVALALYNGLVASKTTETKPSILTTQFYSNAPEGFEAKFSSLSDGTLNSDNTILYKKIEINPGVLYLPSAPNISSDDVKFDGWYTEKKGGTKVTGSVTLTANAKYYARWLLPHKVYWDASGGTGATVTGSFEGGMTIYEEVVIDGNYLKGPLTKGDRWAPTSSTSGYYFAGWSTEPNGNGLQSLINSTKPTEDEITYYACYLKSTYVAPATVSIKETPSPLSGNKIDISYVETASNDIASRGTSSSYYQEFYNYMNNDSYHLYTLMNNNDGSVANGSRSASWAEFRIRHVGQHNSDGSGLTFMLTHVFIEVQRMNSTDTNSGGWASCELRSKMQVNSSIYNRFNTELTANIRNITRHSSKGKFRLLSISEISSDPTSCAINDGSQYSYFQGKVTEFDPWNGYDVLNFEYARGGGSTGATYSNAWNLRTPHPSSSLGFIDVVNGTFTSSGSYTRKSCQTIFCVVAGPSLEGLFFFPIMVWQDFCGKIPAFDSSKFLQHYRP